MYSVMDKQTLPSPYSSANQVLDTQGMLCPIPVIKTQNAVNALNAGDTLAVIATDPGVLHDIPAWCRINGHHCTNQDEAEGRFYLLVKVE